MLKNELSLPGVFEIIPKVHIDDRGFFYESFTQPFYAEMGVSFVQDNHSFSKRGVLRGMHFQPGQAKLIHLISGAIFDVFVDMRKGSSTLGQWGGLVLDSAQRKMLFIPEGFAHGFCVLSDEAHLVYKVSSLYNAKEEGSFYYGDPDVGIVWPEKNPMLSQRDAKAPSFKEVCL